MSKNWIILLLTLTLLKPSISVFKGCQTGEISTYNKNSNSMECRKCPEGCSLCGFNHGKVYCLGCLTDFFYKEGECRRCAQECQFCGGEGLEKCEELKPGYFYNSSLRRADKCSEGCGRCISQNECLECNSGFMSKSTGKKVGKREIVECSRCKDPKCLSCRKTPVVLYLSLEICEKCQEGNHYFLPKRKCVSCQENCLECRGLRSRCIRCKSGYFLNTKSRQCEKYPVENCKEYDSQDQICLSCEPYYALDSEGKSCIPCLEITKGCSTCQLEYNKSEDRNSAVSEKYRGKYFCSSCANGYRRNLNTGGCEEQDDKCLIDGMMADEKGCSECVPGYYFNKDSKKCEQIPENLKQRGCQQYNSQDLKDCMWCEMGYFLKDQTCQKCHSSCSQCEGPRANQCLECPITKLMYKLENKNSKNFFIISDLYQCVDSCSDLNNEYFKFVKSPTGRMCFKEKRSNEPHEEEYWFYRVEEKERTFSGLMKELRTFVRKYRKYVDEDKEKNKNQQMEKLSNYDRVCWFKGKLVEKLSEEKETTYECKCIEGNYGSLCMVSEGLYTKSNKFLKKTLKDVNSKKYSTNFFTKIFISKKLNFFFRSQLNIHTEK